MSQPQTRSRTHSGYAGVLRGTRPDAAGIDRRLEIWQRQLRGIHACRGESAFQPRGQCLHRDHAGVLRGRVGERKQRLVLLTAEIGAGEQFRRQDQLRALGGGFLNQRFGPQSIWYGGGMIGLLSVFGFILLQRFAKRRQSPPLSAPTQSL